MSVSLERRPATAVRRLAPYLLAVGCFAVYTTWSLLRHYAFQSTGFDLGIFEQGIRSYAHGHWPTAELKAPGYPLFGDHFHPIIAVLAPVYRVFPSAETLLIAQAALLAVSVIPVVRLADRKLGTGPAVAIGLAYGLSWGLLNTIAFDFHEVCFAVPLLAFALEQLMLGNSKAAVLISLPLVLVKEDMGATLAAIGLYIAWKGQRRLGFSVAVFGAVTAAVVLLVLLPSFNPAGTTYTYWDNLQHGSGLSVTDGLLLRLFTTLMLLMLTAFIALRSPITVLALPTIAWRFVSGNASYWNISFHYSAVLMPILFVAFVDGLTRHRAWVKRALSFSCAMTLVVGVILALRPGANPQWTSAQQSEARQLLARIPDDTTVAASNRLAPQLTNRCTVSMFPVRPERGEHPEWLAVSVPMDGPVDLTKYEQVAQSDVVLLYHLRSP